jgi:hypothetical protein
LLLVALVASMAGYSTAQRPVSLVRVFRRRAMATTESVIRSSSPADRSCRVGVIWVASFRGEQVGSSGVEDHGGDASAGAVAAVRAFDLLLVQSGLEMR